MSDRSNKLSNLVQFFSFYNLLLGQVLKYNLFQRHRRRQVHSSGRTRTVAAVVLSAVAAAARPLRRRRIVGGARAAALHATHLHRAL